MDRNEALSLDQSNYIVEEFTNDLALVYSKTQADSLPIISMKMATSQPCYNPDERQDKSIFLSTEVGRTQRLGEKERIDSMKHKAKNADIDDRQLSNECTESNGHTTDTRY